MFRCTCSRNRNRQFRGTNVGLRWQISGRSRATFFSKSNSFSTFVWRIATRDRRGYHRAQNHLYRRYMCLLPRSLAYASFMTRSCARRRLSSRFRARTLSRNNIDLRPVLSQNIQRRFGERARSTGNRLSSLILKPQRTLSDESPSSPFTSASPFLPRTRTEGLW